MIRLTTLVDVCRSAAAAWMRDKAPRLGAAISYYALISLAPLLVVAVAIGGSVFGEQAARGEIVGQISGMMGEQSAKTVQEILEHAWQPQKNLVAGAFGVIILLIGAAGVFVELQEALNTIWAVKTKPGLGWRVLVRQYFWSFAMVVGVGFLLLVSLIMSAVLAALGRYVSTFLPGSWLVYAEVGNVLISFAFITLVFAVCFKVVPDVELQWRDVWPGAAVTSMLFTAGKSLIGLYLGHSTLSSAYGAAGSLVVLLVWVYYSTQIMLFGVEFTKCYKKGVGGGPVVPMAHAEHSARKAA